MEIPHHKGRDESETQTGNSPQIGWHNLGSKREDTEDRLPGISETTPRIWLHRMVNLCEKTTQQALDKVQNQALRIITGAMRSTPIKAMEQLTGIQPLNQRREAKIMVQAQKYRCLPDHPMKSKLDSLTKNRLKRSSFVHESKVDPVECLRPQNLRSAFFHISLSIIFVGFFPEDGA